MVIGNCHLCGQRSELIDSHVWSRFAYKRYAADVPKGGKFLDLSAMRLTNTQYTRSWFCQHCDNIVLGQMESYASLFCSKLEKRPTDPQGYDHRLLQFATSISWRTVKLYTEDDPNPLAGLVRPACRQWKDYLRGKKSNVGLYSQHVFAVFDPTVGLHRALGGQVFPDHNLVLSQIGPLQIVGLLGRKQLSLSDLKVWERSQLLAAGGTVAPMTAWHVGKDITLSLTHLLCKHEARLKHKVIEFAHGRSRYQGFSASSGSAAPKA